MTPKATTGRSEPSAASLSDEAAKGLWQRTVIGVEPSARPSGRFQKGQSGNPRGRPKKTPSSFAQPVESTLNALVLAESRRLITVRDGDVTRQMTVEQAIIRSENNQAIKGNAYAQRNGLARIERARLAEAQEIAHEHDIWRAYVDRARARIAEAKTKGETEPQILPHPDDVVIEFGKRVRFAGPINEEELKNVLHTQRMRDHLILQDVLDERMWAKPLPADARDGPGGAALFSLMLDRTLPPRMRLSDTDRMLRRWRVERLPKRALLKMVLQGWRELGVRNIRRGALFPNMQKAAVLVGLIFDLRKGLNEGRLDPDTPNTPAWRALFEKFGIGPGK